MTRRPAWTGRPARPGLSRRALLSAGLGATGLLALTGCTEPGPTGTSGQAEITSANGTITEWPAGSRPAPAAFGGPTDAGGRLTSRQLAGQVVVLNFWYAGCPPCRAEAPDLQALWTRFTDQDVRFVGVNTIDDAATARAFARTYNITYPSILDRADGAVLLAFAGVVSVKAVPTTLVLDRAGRIASRIVGKIPGQSVLRTLIEDVAGTGG